VTCAHAVRVAILKVKGVEGVEVSLRRAMADIRLKPGNSVALDQVRQIVKSNGFTAGEAVVTALGSVTEANSQPAIAVSVVGTVLPIARERSAPEAYEQIVNVLAARNGVMVEISGTIASQAGNSQEVVVTSVKQVSK
jgi:copper chaperone CopZ